VVTHAPSLAHHNAADFTPAAGRPGCRAR
jgi:hypothetical protein